MKASEAACASTPPLLAPLPLEAPETNRVILESARSLRAPSTQSEQSAFQVHLQRENAHCPATRTSGSAGGSSRDEISSVASEPSIHDFANAHSLD